MKNTNTKLVHKTGRALVVGVLAAALIGGTLPLAAQPEATVETTEQAAMTGGDPVNLDHLRFLTESVTIAGEDMAVVHIYSEFPEYEWVDAAGEGLAAVDDVARAAIVYLWQYERTGDPELLDLARRCLNFVLYMQADDGEFYNFVYDAEGTINERGNTSYKSLGWWAMRGLWSLAEGVRVFDEVDPAYADRLAEAYRLTEAALGNTLTNYGQYREVHGFRIPDWIPSSEPQIAGVSLLALSAYQQARPNETTADILTRVADGIAEYRLGDSSTYPFGMHPSAVNAPGFWHDWGTHMAHALVVAGMTMDRQDWIECIARSRSSWSRSRRGNCAAMCRMSCSRVPISWWATRCAYITPGQTG